MESLPTTLEHVQDFSQSFITSNNTNFLYSGHKLLFENSCDPIDDKLDLLFGLQMDDAPFTGGWGEHSGFRSPQEEPFWNSSSRVNAAQEEKKSMKKNNKKKRRKQLPEAAVIILDHWFTTHRDNPYPSTKERTGLIQETGLSRRQVDTWLGNARQRRKHANQPLDPMEMWLSGSSEDEAAEMSDIAKALHQYEASRNCKETNHEHEHERANCELDEGFIRLPTADLSSKRNYDCMSRASSMSSAGSAFDECPEARWQGPPKRGRKKYARGYGDPSRNGSMSSAGSVSHGDAVFRPMYKYPLADSTSPILTRSPSPILGSSVPNSIGVCHGSKKIASPKTEWSGISKTILEQMFALNPEPRCYKCRICQCLEETELQLERHMSVIHSEGLLFCPDRSCGRTFNAIFECACHLKSHDPSQKYWPDSGDEAIEDKIAFDSSFFGHLEQMTKGPPVLAASTEAASSGTGPQSRKASDAPDYSLNKSQADSVPLIASPLASSESRDDHLNSQPASSEQSEGGLEFDRPFQCTFCRVQVSPKSWRRHEESQHLPQKEWICMPTELPCIDGSTCVFCGLTCHDQTHNEVCANRVSDCLKRSYKQRSFNRKDKLKQHIKSFHACAVDDKVLQTWASDNHFAKVFWDCGFCGKALMTWDERAKHIAKHFREGKDMSSWRQKSEAEKIYGIGNDDEEIAFVSSARVALEAHR